MISSRSFCLTKPEGLLLPCSVSSSCGELRGELRGESLEVETREIIHGFLLNFCGVAGSSGRHRSAVRTMKRVVDGLVEKHGTLYKGFLKKLDRDDLDVSSVFTTVVKEVFRDGLTNWGRIASLLAFGAVVCKHQNDMGQGHCVRQVEEAISMYLLSDKRDWLLKNNAWDGFVEFFRVPDPEATMRNTLMAIVTIAGLSAGIAFFSR